MKWWQLHRWPNGRVFVERVLPDDQATLSHAGMFPAPALRAT
jgi:hypothetical protein